MGSEPYLQSSTQDVAFSSTRWHELLSAIWLCIVFVVGTFLNGSTILTFFKNKRLLTAGNIPIIALFLNNFLLCLLAIEMPIVAEFSGHWMNLMNMTACTVDGFMVYLFGLASMYILVAISISRYLAITRPFNALKDDRLPQIFMVISCEVLAAVFAIAPLLGWSSYGLEAHGTSCGLDWRDRSASAYTYLIVITIACFALPVAVMLFCYIRIYIIVRNRPMIRTETRRRQRKERNLLMISIAFVLSFLISWIPYTVVSFYVSYGDPESLDPMLSRSASLVAKSQVLWNPILYMYKTKKIRRELINLLPCRCLTFIQPSTITDMTRFEQTTAAHNDNTRDVSERCSTILTVSRNQPSQINNKTRLVRLEDSPTLSLKLKQVESLSTLLQGSKVQSPRRQCSDKDINSSKKLAVKHEMASSSQIGDEDRLSPVQC